VISDSNLKCLMGTTWGNWVECLTDTAPRYLPGAKDTNEGWQHYFGLSRHSLDVTPGLVQHIHGTKVTYTCCDIQVFLDGAVLRGHLDQSTVDRLLLMWTLHMSGV